MMKGKKAKFTREERRRGKVDGSRTGFQREAAMIIRDEEMPSPLVVFVLQVMLGVFVSVLKANENSSLWAVMTAPNEDRL